MAFIVCSIDSNADHATGRPRHQNQREGPEGPKVPGGPLIWRLPPHDPGKMSSAFVTKILR